MTLVKCDTVEVMIRPYHGPECRCGFERLIIPAYTISREALIERAGKCLAGYLVASEALEQGMSLGDYACLLMAIAADDPREQEAPDTEDTEDTEAA